MKRDLVQVLEDGCFCILFDEGVVLIDVVGQVSEGETPLDLLAQFEGLLVAFREPHCGEPLEPYKMVKFNHAYYYYSLTCQQSLLLSGEQFPFKSYAIEEVKSSDVFMLHVVKHVGVVQPLDFTVPQLSNEGVQQQLLCCGSSRRLLY